MNINSADASDAARMRKGKTQPAGVVAGRITLAQVPFRNAVVTEQQEVVRLLQIPGRAGDERLNVFWSMVIRRLRG